MVNRHAAFVGVFILCFGSFALQGASDAEAWGIKIKIGPVKIKKVEIIKVVVKTPKVVVKTPKVVIKKIEIIKVVVKTPKVKPLKVTIEPIKLPKIAVNLEQDGKNFEKFAKILISSNLMYISTALLDESYRRDVITEHNYFFGTVCGKSSEAKKLQRLHNQGKIDLEELHEAEKKLKPSKAKKTDFCKIGVGDDSKEGIHVYDGQGNRVPKRPEPIDDSPIQPSKKTGDNSGKSQPSNDNSEESKLNSEKQFFVKPPFTHTPFGHKLSYPAQATDLIPVTGTNGGATSLGGEAGMTRTDSNGSPKFHSGIDIAPQGNTVSILAPSTWHGLGVGTVTKVKPSERMGVSVTIKMTVGQETWYQVTAHHHESSVKVGDKLQPGEAYAKGAGNGTIFQETGAGPPHVHVRFYRQTIDGRLETVSPNNGQVIVDPNP